MRSKLTTLSVTLIVILVMDVVTKRWALATLADGRQIDLFGGLVPLTLAFNRGAAFGIEIGDDPRYFFIPITIVALVLLGVLFYHAIPGDWLRVFSVSLVMSGALGNLVDRVRWNRGVVDFIGPIDLGFMDWPIFNVADMAISCGAVMLAISFWLEERQAKSALSQEVESSLADSSTS